MITTKKEGRRIKYFKDGELIEEVVLPTDTGGEPLHIKHEKVKES